MFILSPKLLLMYARVTCLAKETCYAALEFANQNIEENEVEWSAYCL